MKIVSMIYPTLIVAVLVFATGYRTGQQNAAKKVAKQANAIIDSLTRESFTIGVFIGSAEQIGRRKPIEWERLADSILNAKKAGR